MIHFLQLNYSNKWVKTSFFAFNNLQFCNQFDLVYTECMKNFITFTLITISAVVLAACTASTSSPAVTSSGANSGAPAADQKSGDTTKTGSITSANGAFFLQEQGGSPELVESYAVELNEYVGQTVTVTGQYSGDTLFIGSVE